MSRNQNIGRVGEAKARDYLVGEGYKIIETGFRSSRWGELDIICSKDGILVFVEVKTRTSRKFGVPESAVTSHKIRALKRTAFYYCKKHPNCSKSLRIDVISIILDKDLINVKYFKHYKNAF